MNAYPRTFPSAIDRPIPAVPSLPAVAAGLSVFAAAIHIWVVPEHLQEWWGYGAFFLVLAAAQALYAGLILRSRGRRSWCSASSAPWRRWRCMPGRAWWPCHWGRWRGRWKKWAGSTPCATSWRWR